MTPVERGDDEISPHHGRRVSSTRRLRYKESRSYRRSKARLAEQVGLSVRI